MQLHGKCSVKPLLCLKLPIRKSKKKRIHFKNKNFIFFSPNGSVLPSQYYDNNYPVTLTIFH